MSLTVMLRIDDDIVYDRNIYHTFRNTMKNADIYDLLYCPYDLNINHASGMIEPLHQAILTLIARINTLDDTANLDYDYLLIFVIRYLEACRRWPHAEIVISK